MNRTLVLGDVHGAHRALIQVFKASGFDPQNDRLICLGDFCDGWPETTKCFEEILSVRNLVYVLGNHDLWLLEWFISGDDPPIWLAQGGRSTIDSYLNLPLAERNPVSRRHQELLEKAVYYFIDERNRVYTHGGFDWKKPLDEQKPRFGETPIYCWDRSMIRTAWNWHRFRLMNPNKAIPGEVCFPGFTEIFVGHTPTDRMDPSLKPVQISNLRALDQGAGYGDKLTLMDVDSMEYWQSDRTEVLYGFKASR